MSYSVQSYDHRLHDRKEIKQNQDCVLDPFRSSIPCWFFMQEDIPISLDFLQPGLHLIPTCLECPISVGRIHFTKITVVLQLPALAWASPSLLVHVL